MKTTDLIAEINAHINAQLEAIDQPKNDELKEALRWEVVTIIKKQLDLARVIRIARRQLKAKLENLPQQRIEPTKESVPAAVQS